MTVHASIDLETLGTSADAPIVQIGVQLFDLERGYLYPDGRHQIDVQPYSMAGASAQTVAWWLEQTASARAACAHAINTGTTTSDALAQLAGILLRTGCEHVWGNGTTFDIAILEQAYRKDEGAPPWRYNQPRDMRTLVDAAATLRGFDKKSIEFAGVPHFASHDAAHQARVICAAWEALR
jgi:hypothetical protein